MTTFFSPQQVRAACGLLGWNGSDLALKLGISKQAISAYLSERAGLSGQNLEKIAYFIDLAGVEFTSNDGIRRKSLRTRTYHGQEGMVEFMNLVYETARDKGGEFCVSNVDETLFTERMGEEAGDTYSDKMVQIKGNYTFRILIKEGDTNFVASTYAQYRQIAGEQFHNVPFYVFGDYLAFLIFEEQTTVHLIHNENIADAQRTQFYLSWKSAKPC